MNDVDLAKNILLNHICETCKYLRNINKLIICTKGPNDKKTVLINSCDRWAQSLCAQLSLSDINKLLQDWGDALGIPKEYIIGK